MKLQGALSATLVLGEAQDSGHTAGSDLKSTIYATCGALRREYTTAQAARAVGIERITLQRWIRAPAVSDALDASLI